MLVRKPLTMTFEAKPCSACTRIARAVARLLLPVLVLVAAAGGLAHTAAIAAIAAAPGVTPARGVDEWLTRMHLASQRHNFVGTFVVSSQAGSISSGRIWHAYEGGHHAEKVESLTGTARSTLRRHDELLTLLPDQRLARIERRQAPGPFPDLLKSPEASIADFYAVREGGTDRVAGFETDVVLIDPRDRYRYGYRIWSEKKSGLVVKLQTVDAAGQVLEQAVFSELQIGASPRPSRLVRSMAPPPGWRVERIENIRTTAADEGWELRSPVAGFKSMGCLRRGGVQDGASASLQCVFSDGLASVSLFIEPYDRQRHAGAQAPLSAGASQTEGRRLQDWWLTCVGEVPPPTLRAFLQALERRK